MTENFRDKPLNTGCMRATSLQVCDTVDCSLQAPQSVGFSR